MKPTLIKSCQINSLDDSVSSGFVSVFVFIHSSHQGLQSLSSVDCCVQRPTAGLSARRSHLWNCHPSISRERGPSFASATRFPLFGAVLSAIVDLIIVRIELRSELVEGDVPVRSSIAQRRGDTRGDTSVGGPRSFRRPSDLRGLQYLRRGVAGENPHARSSVPVRTRARARVLA